MIEATLNGKILVDHKINLNEPIGGDGRILLDIISKDDELNDLYDSSWYIDTVVDSEDVLSLQKEYVDEQIDGLYHYEYKLWVKVGNLKKPTFFFLGNAYGDLFRIDILPQIIK